uniref:Uncharacterized protein n=1 Tax=Alexandrium monilatum TaxID=311494 RepID=A0A7S4RQH6_9DINO|mmetsp:Transcript_104/g.346  ORF Transcript_104/g.346 Transcript_104/m.346 type:complete len:140 (+) Transcript_104:56-475(+)|eukprot:CAMPEP_0175370556 /NCGR_PEP_ID=MMETSP0095-20121207/21268_1 /TAXON_ID=311494 /ORGANISM="Alexandrium monilatum, Strain CCMP3105" /LENGTH=139 /DNA_ID=CAMNT_0016668707 /DNA_START=56 /DNA_END=475 /DNA_ORIENTATION=+
MSFFPGLACMCCITRESGDQPSLVALDNPKPALAGCGVGCEAPQLREAQALEVRREVAEEGGRQAVLPGGASNETTPRPPSCGGNLSADGTPGERDRLESQPDAEHKHKLKDLVVKASSLTGKVKHWKQDTEPPACGFC